VRQLVAQHGYLVTSTDKVRPLHCEYEAGWRAVSAMRQLNRVWAACSTFGVQPSVSLVRMSNRHAVTGGKLRTKRGLLNEGQGVSREG
jgi:hypothetical protein